MRRWLAGLLTAALPLAWSAPSGFVQKDGLRLTLDGKPYVMAGLNVYNAASDGNCWYPMSLTRSLRQMTGNVIRVWFFQRLATKNGRRDWRALDGVLAAARKRGMKVLPVLTDQWGKCEWSGLKSESWYRDGYREVDPGGTVSYRDWVGEVMRRYRDDPTVALWTLVNEAEAPSGFPGECAPSAVGSLRAFADDVGAVAKAAAPDHLLTLGTMGGGQCGTAGQDFQTVYASPPLDVCEYHDYHQPAQAIPGNRWDGLAVRLEQCKALGKPLFVGEVGIDANATGGVRGRANAFSAKASAQLAAGVVGFVVWAWSDAGRKDGDSFMVKPGDPVLNVLAKLAPGTKRR
ncbi:glycoside hydrolase family 5 protein [Nonomuraea sp. NBC_01738]|uniref:hypothetical protein n=1 Tax=Nonomuraea sp. NBC_01738 TaxID=2976003 RepID=UPI002E138C48|nr:glycoside hydrolase family 5 protein [Nonomuraea sp. NBC_01738]